MFNDANPTFHLCDGWGGRGGDSGFMGIGGNHAWVGLDGKDSSVSIKHDSNFTIYTSKNNCEFNYGNGWIDSIWGKDYLMGEYCRCYPSNNTNAQDIKENDKNLTFTFFLNGTRVDKKFLVDIKVYPCYRNYYEYTYDSNGNFTKIINDVANDNFKNISW